MTKNEYNNLLKEFIKYKKGNTIKMTGAETSRFLKKILKAMYPNTLFKTHYQTFSGGDSLHIYHNNKEKQNEIYKFVQGFQYYNGQDQSGFENDYIFNDVNLDGIKYERTIKYIFAKYEID